MVIQKIKEHDVLSKFIEDTCCENNVCITFDADISLESYIIIKVDDFYKSLKLGSTPRSVDCLILRQCANGDYGLILVELKKARKSKRISKTQIEEKFENTLNDFMTRFKDVFPEKYKEIKLYLISKIKRDRTLTLEYLMNKQIKFNNKVLGIRPEMNHFVIKNC